MKHSIRVLFLLLISIASLSITANEQGTSQPKANNSFIFKWNSTEKLNIPLLAEKKTYTSTIQCAAGETRVNCSMGWTCCSNGGSCDDDGFPSCK